MKNFKKRNFIIVPKNVQVIYCNQKNILTFIGPLLIKSIKLKIKLLLIFSLNSVIVTQIPLKKKLIVHITLNIIKIQNLTVSKIKQILIEIIFKLYHKLNLVGLGYKVFIYNKESNQIYFKLGYSHSVYFRIPSKINFYCFKSTKFILINKGSQDLLTKTIEQLKSCRSLDIYKGKGILSNLDKITLKKGKKI